MTSVNEIMAEALKSADIGDSPTRDRAQRGEHASISPGEQPVEALEPGGITLSPEQLRARRSRSIAIGLALGVFVAVIFAVTIVRLGSAALTRPIYMQPVQAQGTK